MGLVPKNALDSQHNQCEAKEALHRWHFLDGWSSDKSQDYMPDDVTEVAREAN